MLKKTSIIVAAGLALAGALSPQASYARTPDPGEIIYPFATVLARKLEIDRLMDEQCHFDYECEKQFYQEFYEAESTAGIDTLIKQLNETIILVTALNPTERTMRVWYNHRYLKYDERDNNEDGPNVPPTQFKIQWPTISDPNKRVTFNDVSVLKMGEEAEIQMDEAGAYIDDLSREAFYFDLSNAHLSGHGGREEYGECFTDSPTPYQAGMECQAMISSKGIEYFAAWPKDYVPPVEPSGPSVSNPELPQPDTTTSGDGGLGGTEPDTDDSESHDDDDSGASADADLPATSEPDDDVAESDKDSVDSQPIVVPDTNASGNDNSVAIGDNPISDGQDIASDLTFTPAAPDTGAITSMRNTARAMFPQCVALLSTLFTLYYIRFGAR